MCCWDKSILTEKVLLEIIVMVNFSLLNSKAARRRGAYLFLFIFSGGVNDEHHTTECFFIVEVP